MGAIDDEVSWRIAGGIAALADSTVSGEELARQVRLVYANEPLAVLQSATNRALTIVAPAKFEILDRLEKAVAILDGTTS